MELLPTKGNISKKKNPFIHYPLLGFTCLPLHLLVWECWRSFFFLFLYQNFFLLKFLDYYFKKFQPDTELRSRVQQICVYIRCDPFTHIQSLHCFSTLALSEGDRRAEICMLLDREDVWPCAVFSPQEAGSARLSHRVHLTAHQDD